MKIVHLTTVHPRDDVRIYNKECKSLAEVGWDVHLVVADGGGFAEDSLITVHDIGKRKKNRVFRLFINSYQAFSLAIKLKPDIIHIHDPELLLFAERALTKKIKVIYDIHEDMQQQIRLKKYIPKLLRGLASLIFGFIENAASRKMSALIVPQEAMRLKFSAVNKRCINIPNYVDLNLYPKKNKIFFRPIIFHAGALSNERGLANMVSFANELGDRGDVVVAGSLPQYFASSALGKLKYLGRLEYSDVLKWYSESNIGAILYNNVGQYGMANAVKSFEYMASAIPILMPNFGEWIEFNEKNDCGLNVDVTDPMELSKAVMWLIANPMEAERLGMNGRNRVELEYSWQAVSGRLIDLYRGLMHEGK